MKFEQLDIIKRLAIFFFYDKDGVVDDYIPYMLKDLSKNISELLIVCNGKLTSEGRTKFNELTSHILVRDNVGYDAWAYKEGLEYYGWEKLGVFDEIVLLNYTIMGPIFPFENMFEEMKTKNVDFWGITRIYDVENDPFQKIKHGGIPEFIEMGFIVIRSPMVKSIEFHRFWINPPLLNDNGETFCIREEKFIQEFTEKGFTYEPYVNTDDLKENYTYPLMLYPAELIEKRKCPIFIRKTFYDPYDEFLDVSCGQSGYDLYKYLAEKTDYNLNYIWDTILRNGNMADIKERMQLNYILPTYFRLPNEGKNSRVALFMHLYYLDQVEYCKQYADSMPLNADIYITTNSEEKKVVLEKAFDCFNGRKVEVLVIENRGRDVSSLLVGLRPFVERYDYICFAHDKKSVQIKPSAIGESFAYHCFENVLSNRNFVENVITTFNENPRLGLLVPPPPIHGIFPSIIGNEWTNNFENTQKLAEKYQINIDIDRRKTPIGPLGTIFWFRPQALNILFKANLGYDDFPAEPIQIDGTKLHALERLYTFCAQQTGYYSAWVLTDTFAKMELTNLYKILIDYNKTLIKMFGSHNRYDHMMSLSNLLNTWQYTFEKNISFRSITKIWIKSFLVRIFGKNSVNNLYERIQKVIKRSS